mmetsp:Transcript_12719/g.34667  ORF Transcript_12719/g.34667 Transcript_12719/m.34667 type:complete len:261 (+) Transcript_12719:463-1245(+)
MCAKAPSSTTTLWALSRSNTRILSAVLIYSFSTLRPARMMVSFLSGLVSELLTMSSTLLVFASAPTFFNRLNSVLVLPSWTLPSRFSTTIMSSAALCKAVARASRRSFLFMLMLQSLGLGPKVMPPPGKRGDTEEPRRALPVPFCAIGFLPPPRTSARVFVLAVPLRLFCWTITIYRCTRPLAVSSATFSASLPSPLSAPVTSFMGTVASFTVELHTCRLCCLLAGRTSAAGLDKGCWLTNEVVAGSLWWASIFATFIMN